MFTNQWAQIENALRQGGELGDRSIAALAQLGNCIAPLQHRGPIELVSSYPNAANFPLNFAPIENAIAPLIVDNRFSFKDNDNHVHNGFAAFFRGVVNIEGDLVIRNFFGAGPGKGPPGAPGTSSTGGSITIINNSGVASALTALWVGKATSTITARVAGTLGTGPAEYYTLNAGSTVLNVAVTVLNPFSFVIYSDTYLMIGKIKNGATEAYIILAVDGCFEPAYAVRNNASYSHTKGTSENITLDTEIHSKQNGDFTRSGNEITVANKIMVHIDFSAYLSAVGGTTAGVVRLQDDGTDIAGTERTYSVGPAGIFHVNISIDHCMSAANKKIRARITESGGAEDTYIYGASGTGYARLDIRKIRNIV